MGIKYNPDEPYEKWIEKVRTFEYGSALQRIAQNEDIQTVLQDMSRRIVEKLMHPILKEVTKERPEEREKINKELELSRERFKENYINRIPPKSDHIQD